jgi:hypothetical protein
MSPFWRKVLHEVDVVLSDYVHLYTRWSSLRAGPLRINTP